VFTQITKSQILDYEIDGRKIRMDSKLLGSNIAWCSRYELVHGVVSKVYFQDSKLIEKSLSKKDIETLKSIVETDCKNINYHSTTSEIESKLEKLGFLLYKIITKTDCSSIDILKKLFDEQFAIVDGEVFPLKKENIKAASIQSPHDPDCHFRTKGEINTKGYSVNVTETCNPDNKINLTTDVAVYPASISDCDVFEPAVETTKSITGQKTVTINTDGAYHSESNQKYCTENDIDHVMSALPGTPSRYDFTLDESGELVVTDTYTDEIIPSQKVKSRKANAYSKWKFITEKQIYRYVTQKDIDSCSCRKIIQNRTKKELNIRNNIEATIFQIPRTASYSLEPCIRLLFPHDKSRYRGLIKHKMWANTRCIWINFVRILKYFNHLQNTPDIITFIMENIIKNMKMCINLQEKKLLQKFEVAFLLNFRYLKSCLILKMTY
jgi:hypothetical protein